MTAFISRSKLTQFSQMVSIVKANAIVQCALKSMQKIPILRALMNKLEHIMNDVRAAILEDENADTVNIIYRVISDLQLIALETRVGGQVPPPSGQALDPQSRPTSTLSRPMSELSQSIEVVEEDRTLSDDELSIEFIEHDEVRDIDAQGSPNMYNSAFVEFANSKCL